MLYYCKDDEQLEGSGFVFSNITKAIIEFYRTRDISAKSFIELPEKYRNSKSVIIMQNDDVFCFLWCIFDRLYSDTQNRNRASIYSKTIHAPENTKLRNPHES